MFKQIHRLLLFLVLLWALAPPSTQAQVINCPSGFASTGACGVGIFAGGNSFQLNGTTNGPSPGLVGSHVDLIPTGADHVAWSLNYQRPVDDQAFAASFRFVPNGQNIAFVIQNSNNNPDFNGLTLSAGAGCEAGFFQAYSQAEPPNNVFALELDSYSPLTETGSFTNSSVQIYQSGQSPCLPSIQNYPAIDKISTAPVDLTTGSQNTTTGDTYSATVTYDGSNLTLNLYNVTAGGSCPGPSCFTHTWNNVDIPAWVSGDTASVGFTAATGLTSNSPLYIDSLVYTEGGPTSTLTPMPSPATPTLLSTSSLTPGTYHIGSLYSGGYWVIDSGFFTSYWGFPPVAEAFPENGNPIGANPSQQFTFAASGSSFTICDVVTGACLTDGGSVVAIGQGTDTWAVARHGAGWSIQNTRTGGYMGAIPDVSRGNVPMSSTGIAISLQ